MVNSIPIMPQGVGTGQAGYKFLFAAFGSSGAHGVTIITLMQMIMFLWNQTGWIFYLKGRSKYRAALAAETAEAAADAGELATED